MSPPACPPPQSNARTLAIRKRRKKLTHKAEAVKGTAMKTVGRLTGTGAGPETLPASLLPRPGLGECLSGLSRRCGLQVIGSGDEPCSGCPFPPRRYQG
jgi:hypothetical protein